MEDASPTRWHIAHTTWFFETFVLCEYLESYTRYNDVFPYLFNSYYIQAGERFSRAERGMLTRPTVEEVFKYRSHVDVAMRRLLSQKVSEDVLRVVEIGLNHEQQHQELILTDVKHMLYKNPLHPAYDRIVLDRSQDPGDISWIAFEEALVSVGTDQTSFHFDNEGPSHKTYLQKFELSNRLVTNREYSAFVHDGGYERAEFWLSEGWSLREREGWDRPFYWVDNEGSPAQYTLGGLQNLDPNEPICHVSYFEADAYARWAGCRLPTEFEWEEASRNVDLDGNFIESGRLHPRGADDRVKSQLQNMFGNLWEWTRSQYSPYPGYAPEPGALGEYNGKFMSNQFVLRGGSFATSRTHIRRTYRNFFPSYARWQFTGIRLARDPQ